MSVSQLIGRLLGLDGTHSIDRIRPALAAPWVRDGAAWLVFALVGLIALALVFYVRYQGGRRLGPRLSLGMIRAVLLGLLLVILAEPVLTVHVTRRLRPSLWLLFDGSDSMGVADDLPDADRARLARAVGLPEATRSADRSKPPQRVQYLKALARKKEANLLVRLGEKFRLRAFLFDRPDGVRALELAPDDDRINPSHLASQLTTDGEVTAIGAALDDLARRQATGNLAGLVVFSDFNQNAGPAPLEAATRLGVKVYTVGVGPVAAVDLSVDLQAPPVMKKDERSSLTCTVRHEGLEGRSVDVIFHARPLSGPLGEAPAELIGRRSVRLDRATQTVELPHTPNQTGRFVFTAEVDSLEGEVVQRNNRAERETTVRDDFLRL
ncbi:MAG: hypothetical protein HQ582_02905, partial [Planctomycetes bacterium]|nr:hypothetical protein [Planctomycetota bacterium]